MKQIITFSKNTLLIIVLVIMSFGISENMYSQANKAEDTEKLLNNFFDDALNNWEVWGSIGTLEIDATSVLEGTNSALVQLTSAGGGESWELGIAQSIPDGIIEGKSYTVRYQAKASSDITIELVVQEVDDPWDNYYESTLDVGTTPQTFEETFTANITGECNFVFQLGAIGMGTQVWIDDVHFIELDGANVNNISDSGYELEQNYPNPAKSSTKINFTLPKTDFANISIYNIAGKKVLETVNRKFPSGKNSIDINLEDLPSGIFFYQLKTSDYIKTMKMTIVE